MQKYEKVCIRSLKSRNFLLNLHAQYCEPVKDSRLHSYRQIMRWLWNTWKGYRLQAILNVFVGVLIVFTDLAFVWCTKVAVDIATGIPHNNLQLWHVMLLLVIVVVVQVSMTIVNRWIRAVLGVRGQNRMQEQLFNRLLRSDWMALRRHHTGHLVNRLEKDVNVVMALLTENIPSLLTTIIRFLGAFVLLLYMDKDLALVVVAIAPFFALCSRLYVGKMRSVNHEVRDADAAVQGILQEGLQHSLVLKSLERIPLQSNRLVSSHRWLRRMVVEYTKYSSASVGLMNSAFAIGYLVAFFWGVYGLQEGRITFGALIAFIQLVSQIQQPVRQLARFVPVIISSSTAVERLMELERMPRESREQTAGTHVTADDMRVRLDVDNIAFAYEGRQGKADKEIFQGFSASFAPGSVTAIVGHTGSGKTTLISLLLGLLHPTRGRIMATVEGQGSFLLSADTRYLFSYVPQGNTLLSGSIRENLQLGNPYATEEEMKEALLMAQAGFVLDFPEGLDTLCGERGGGLSEGQAQRVGIARALLRKSPVLILDEAFSSLDSDTATTAMNAILAAYPHRTIIYITHREALMPYAKHIIRI